MIQRAAGLGATLVLALSACSNSGGATGVVLPPPGTGGVVCPFVLPATPPVVLAYPASGTQNVATNIGTLYFQTTSSNSGAVGTGIPVLTVSGTTTTITGSTLAQAQTLPPNATQPLSSYETSTVPTLAPNTTYTISLISAQNGCTLATGLGTFST